MWSDAFQLYVCVYVCVYVYEMRIYSVLTFKPNYFYSKIGNMSNHVSLLVKQISQKSTNICWVWVMSKNLLSGDEVYIIVKFWVS